MTAVLERTLGKLGRHLPWLAPAAISAWALLLKAALDLPMTGALALMALAGLLLGIVWLVSPAPERRLALSLFLIGLWVCTLQTLAWRTFPQWSDSNPDSRQYDGQARALALHWRGDPAAAAEHYLKGLQRQGIAQWVPGDDRPYDQILGVGRYFYPLYVAAIYWLADGSRMTAISGHLPMLAANVAVVFLLALSLFRRRDVAWLATGLVLLDGNLALWGSVLMRDALILLLASLALLGSVRLWRGGAGGWANGLLLLGALGLQSVVRFNAVAALIFAGLAAAVAGWRASTRRRALFAAVGMGAALSVLVQTVPGLAQAWENSLPGHVVHENLLIFQGAKQVVQAATDGSAESHEKMDGVRREWHANLRAQPLWVNLARAAARSLMGPFPWVALTHGLSGTNFYELMYPGMALWMLCLPAFFYALWRVPARDDPAVLLCLVWLGTATLIYMIGYGQLDGRSRMMVQSLLWIFTAQGIVWLREKWPERR